MDGGGGGGGGGGVLVLVGWVSSYYTPRGRRVYTQRETASAHVWIS